MCKIIYNNTTKEGRINNATVHNVISISMIRLYRSYQQKTKKRKLNNSNNYNANNTHPTGSFMANIFRPATGSGIIVPSIRLASSAYHSK